VREGVAHLGVVEIRQPGTVFALVLVVLVVLLLVVVEVTGRRLRGRERSGLGSGVERDGLAGGVEHISGSAHRGLLYRGASRAKLDASR
jgi:hypothetical protein